METKYSKISNTRYQLEKWLQTAEIKGNVLDIGGYSKPRGYKILDYKGGDYVYDLNKEIPYLKDELPKFDTILCLEVMEYIFNPIQALTNINHLLNKDGILYISFHSLFPHHDPENIDYLRYTKRGVEKLLIETGFEILEIIPRITIVPEILEAFCNAESKVYNNKNEIGYLIKCKKVVL